jgi:branched-chain amino acid transport system permease protein
MTGAAVTSPAVAFTRSRWNRLAPYGLLVLVIAYLAGTGGIAHGSGYTQSLILQAAIFGMLAVSLDLVAGMTGLYSLGHAGLFALGAYATTLLNQAGWNMFLLLPVSIVGVGLIGAVLGMLSLRVSGLYFAIMTFIFTLVVNVLLSDLKFTGGLNGIAGPIFPDLPTGLQFLGSGLVWVVALLLLITLVVVWGMRSSAMYPVLLAIRDAEPFAAANGVRTAATKVGVFALSAGIAGMAGWAFSFLGYISPGQFTWTFSVNILVMVIFGGINTRIGPLIGAAFVSAFPVVVQIDPLVQELIFGLIFLLVIVFFPGGVVGLVARLWRRRTSSPHHAPAPARASANQPIGFTELTTDASGTTAATTVAPDDFILECSAITFGYVRGTKALEEVELRVRRGTVHGLIGPNGSGKSTLVNLISGALKPDTGTIAVRGDHIERLGAAARPARGITRTFQTAVLVKELPVRENVTIGLYHRTRSVAARSLIWPLLPRALREHREMRASADAALRAAGLPAGWGSARVADVPHGVEQLTQLAAARIGRPDILILDEPLAGLSVGGSSRWRAS